MKVSSINNTSPRSQNNNDNINNKNNVNYANNSLKNGSSVNFTGVTDGLIKFWYMIDNGGRGIQFTVEDMCGTNIERTGFGIYNDLKSYSRRKKDYEERRKKGQLRPGEKPPELFTPKSFPSTLQEGVREFLTGPIMTFMPAVVLSVAKKQMGKTSDTHLINIINLSEIMKNLPQDMIKENGLEAAYIENVVRDMLSTTLKNDTPATEEQIKTLVDAMKNYYSKYNSKEKINKKELSKELQNVQDTFAGIIKENKQDFKTSTFLRTRFSLPYNNVGKTKFKNYADYVCAYLSDFTKENTKDKIDKNIVEAFRNSWLAKRSVVNIAMFAITALAMSYIPKLYTKVSGNINPNGIDVYEQAGTLNNNRNDDNSKEKEAK